MTAATTVVGVEAAGTVVAAAGEAVEAATAAEVADRVTGAITVADRTSKLIARTPLHRPRTQQALPAPPPLEPVVVRVFAVGGAEQLPD